MGLNFGGMLFDQLRDGDVYVGAGDRTLIKNIFDSVQTATFSATNVSTAGITEFAEVTLNNLEIGQKIMLVVAVDARLQESEAGISFDFYKDDFPISDTNTQALTNDATDIGANEWQHIQKHYIDTATSSTHSYQFKGQAFTSSNTDLVNGRLTAIAVS